MNPPVSLLKELRPLLSLSPLDTPLLDAAVGDLSSLNADPLGALVAAVQAGGPVVAILGCRRRWRQGQHALEAFRGWSVEGFGQPILITGNSRLPDWSFRFCPDQRWLQLPCRDSYEALPQKILTLFWVLSLLPRPPAVLKVDDDARPGDPSLLGSLLDRLGTEKPTAAGFPIVTSTPLCLERAWHIGKSRGRANGLPFDSLGADAWLSGGAGYLLNVVAVRSLGDFALHSWGFVQSMLYEDVCVSLLLQAARSSFHWLDDPHALGVNSERHQEIESGAWHPPAELLQSLISRSSIQ